MARPILTISDALAALKDGGPDAIRRLDDSAFKFLVAQAVKAQREDRRENQIAYYKPVSPMAERVHMSQTRYRGVGGGNGACLPLTAPVLVVDGTWRQLGDLKPGDMVIAANPVTGEAVPAPVVRVYRSGVKSVFRVNFSDGGFVEASREHEIPVYSGSGKKTSKGNPMVPRKRRLGEWAETVETRGPAKRISCVSPRDIRYAAAELPLHPYLLGALLGDGGLTKMTRFFNVDQGVIERVRRHCDELGVDMVRYDDVSWGLKGRSWHSNPLRATLKDLGLYGCDSHSKFIPAAVFGLSREDRMQFLAGLIDTDGSVNTFVSVSADLVTGFARLVRSLGGKATVTWRDSPGCFGVYWRLNERLPLSLPHKQSDGAEGREIDYARRVCRSVEYVGEFECGDIEVDHPAHCYVAYDYVIVSNSKTDTMLAEYTMHATGLYPHSIKPEVREALKKKFRGPVAMRVVVESLKNTLYPIILPKLQWWKWNGASEPGGDKGHWGWVPRRALINGNWQQSWSEKTLTLRTLCFDPEDQRSIVGESTWQFMSKDQDPTDFASGDFHWILHDELPSYPIWRENEARTMRVGGHMDLSFTWPDDPAIPVDWVYDLVYEKGLPGPDKDPNVDWFEMWSTDNPNLMQDSVAMQSSTWTDEVAAVRIKGQPIRFSNRIHPLFTDRDTLWCFKKNGPCGGGCSTCTAYDTAAYNHVQDFEVSPILPTIQLLDPHPRKPHYLLWVQVDTWDDLWVFEEALVDGEPEEVRERVYEIEKSYGIRPALRLGDPNMLKSPSGVVRGRTWQDEFAGVGLYTDLADTSDVGRGLLNEFLKPDPDRRTPRIHIHPRCTTTIRQMKRYVWEDWKHTVDKDQKQMAKAKEDDMPTLLKYLMNFGPTCEMLQGGPRVITTRKVA